MDFADSLLSSEYRKALQLANMELLDAGVLTDVTVVVGRREFPCHKFILAAWSDYFNSMLRSEWKECKDCIATLKECDFVTEKSFGKLYELFYRGRLEFDLDTIEIILPTVHYLRVEGLSEICIERLRSQYIEGGVTVDRLVAHLQIADTYNLPVMRQAVLSSLAEDFDAFASSVADLVLLSIRDLLSLLAMDSLKASSEDVVFRAAFSWLRKDPTRMTSRLCDVIKVVRLGLVRTVEVREQIDKDVVLVMAEDDECRTILLDALAKDSSDERLMSLRKAYPDMFLPRTVNIRSPSDRFSDHETTSDVEELFAKNIQRAYTNLTAAVSADMLVSVKGRVFQCHKAILWGWSKFFQTKIASLAESPLHGGVRESTEFVCAANKTEQRDNCREDVTLEPDVDVVTLSGEALTPAVFGVVLDWIYRGQWNVTTHNVCEVLTCARCLQVMQLFNLLETYIKDRLIPNVGALTPGETVALLSESRRCNIRQIQDSVLSEILARSFHAVSQCPEFVELLDIGNLLGLLQSDELVASDEDVVFQAAISWLRHEDGRLVHLCDVIKSTRLGLVNVSNLKGALQLAFSTGDASSQEAFDLLLHALTRETDPAIQLNIPKGCPKMMEQRKASGDGGYKRVPLVETEGQEVAAGRIKLPRGVSAEGDVVWVVDRGRDSVLAFRRSPEGDHQPIGRYTVKRPADCVAVTKNTAWVTSCLFRGQIIRVCLDKARRQTKTLTGGGRLKWPRNLDYDATTNSLFVSCEDGVHRVRLTDDGEVAATLATPPGIDQRWAGSVSVLRGKILVKYGDYLVLYANDRDVGRVLQIRGIARPEGITHNGDDYLVADRELRCLHVISSKGKTVTKLTLGQVTPDMITAISTICYVTDWHNKSLFIFNFDKTS